MSIELVVKYSSLHLLFPALHLHSAILQHFRLFSYGDLIAHFDMDEKRSGVESVFVEGLGKMGIPNNKAGTPQFVG